MEKQEYSLKNDSLYQENEVIIAEQERKAKKDKRQTVGLGLVATAILAMLPFVASRNAKAYSNHGATNLVPVISREVPEPVEVKRTVKPAKLEEEVEIEVPVKKEKIKSKYSERDIREVGRIVFAEGANQPKSNRELIARTIVNRAEDDSYPSTPYKVIHQRNAFSCTFDGNKLWAQANGKKKMNAYEKSVFKKCLEYAREVCSGKKQGIPGEDEIIAYHDISIKKPNQKYWRGLKRMHKNKRLIFYGKK